MESGQPARKKVKRGTLDGFIVSSIKSEVKSPEDDEKSDCSKLDSPLKWKKITAEDLCLDFCPQFYSKHEADLIFKMLEEDLEYFTGALSKVFVYGKWHNVPRKQVTYGEPGLSYKFSGITVPSQPWPQVLLDIKDKLSKATGNYFNFVLVNRYNDGSDYMGEHRDNEKELDPLAPIASVSFGQTRDFIFTHGSTKYKKGSPPGKKKIMPVKLVLEHGSVLLMQYPTNTYWYHSLPRRKTAHGVRINLTFRKVNMSNCGK